MKCLYYHTLNLTEIDPFQLPDQNCGTSFPSRLGIVLLKHLKETFKDSSLLISVSIFCFILLLYLFSRGLF